LKLAWWWLALQVTVLSLSLFPLWRIASSGHSNTERTWRECEKQEVLERINRLLSLIRHGPHWKRRVQQFFYCCVCIRYHGNVSTEPLPSKDRGIFTGPLPSNDRGYTDTSTRARTHTNTDSNVISYADSIFWK
jgi:hypothetical protein